MKQTSGKFRSVFLPLLAALIWGTAFVAQKISTIGALLFNASRSIIAVLFLLGLILVLNKGDVRHVLSEPDKKATKELWVGGILCGLSMGIATFFQQQGMNMGTEAGKAGFLTALYIMLVPVLGIFLKKKTNFKVWICVALAVIGLYFLSIPKGSFTIRMSDLLVICCGFMFAVQIQCIDHYSVKCDCVKLSCIQFITSFTVSFLGALIFEKVSFAGIMENLYPILYLGVFSSGIAYTLQMLAQKGNNPAVVSVLMSMESVFSVLAGALFLHEILTMREYLGCLIMLAAVLLTQAPDNMFKKLRK